MFRALLEGVVRRIPSQCAVCHAWPSQPVCENCVAQFAQPVPRCRQCALTVLPGMHKCSACTAQTSDAPAVLDEALAAVTYAYPWSGMVVDFKFHERTGWARSFAALMRSVPWVEPALDAADWLVPMPLSSQRMQERGFNQAQLLARALEPHKVRADVLLRIRNTPPQSALGRRARMTSVAGAFAVDPLSYARVARKRIVLLDDVMTSGASLASAAAALRSAGAAHITALVFARTESPPHSA
jgi:ComF family protein